MKNGRPTKWNTPEELEELCNKYFIDIPLEKQCITGLALHLDTNRETLCSYGNKDMFSDTIKKAKARVEYAYEQRGLTRGNAFDIFALKNLGWTDRQELTGENGGAIIMKWQK